MLRRRGSIAPSLPYYFLFIKARRDRNLSSYLSTCRKVPKMRRRICFLFVCFSLKSVLRRSLLEAWWGLLHRQSIRRNDADCCLVGTNVLPISVKSVAVCRSRTEGDIKKDSTGIPKSSAAKHSSYPPFCLMSSRSVWQYENQ